MANFAYFDKPIERCSNSELIRFYVAFKNGANLKDENDQKRVSRI